ncbi:TPA: integrating conjugative element protein [Pseudomonas aeruginosa]|nr:integrating conjugative element protein [Pseudomonas aeruginosa]
MKQAAYLLVVCATLRISPAVAQAPEESSLTVVEDRGGVSAAPYYEAISPQPDASPPPSVSTPRRHAEDDMLPVRTLRLSPGPVAPRQIHAPGLSPLFLVGDDEHSRAWLRRHHQMLRQLKAVGLVVNVESASALRTLRDLVPGLELAPVAADDLAQRLDLTHYPVLITATGIRQ